MFSALLRAPVYFVGQVVEFVELFGNGAPIISSVFPGVRGVLLDNEIEEEGLFFDPAVFGEGVLFEAEPLEHAGLACDAGDEIGDVLPVIFVLDRRRGTSPFSMEEMELTSAYLEMTQIKILMSS